jgi:Protein of unknown function (DUF2752)
MTSAKRVLFAATLATGLIVASVLFFLDPSHVPIYPTCAFHRITGLNCPGCGCLRAMHQLLHGHFVAALHFNAFLVLSLPLFAWVAYRFVRHEMKGEPKVVVRRLWLWSYLGLWVAFAIVRELPVPFLAAFSP